MAAAERIRSFVALELPLGPREALARCCERFQRAHRAASSQVKWVAPENAHLTLKFLGPVEAGRLTRIEEALRAAMHGLPPLRLQLGGLGCFPGPGRARVLWVGLEGDLATLADLDERVERACEAEGFPREARAFRPHVTLGRVRENAPRAVVQAIGPAWLALGAPAASAARWTIPSMSLMQSQLGREGPRYTRLAELALG